MRIAAFNVENLFERARALKLDWDKGRVHLERYKRLNELFAEPVYTDEIKQEIVQLLLKFGLRKDDEGRYARLRQNRGRLVKRPKTGGLEIVAKGRADWIGWIELTTEPVNELATRHTAMVMRDVNADVLAVVEAENRVALKNFSSILLEAVEATPYRHVMVIDGNDDRGIDVGVMTRAGYDIVEMRSHVDDEDDAGPVFGRDCPEYVISTPQGNQVVLLVNHLKSKGFGLPRESNEIRRRQAQRVAEIYERLRAQGTENVVVAGDLNDIPGSAPLARLLAETDLRDISTHENFADDGRPGTYKSGSKSNKIDYVLLSPALFARVTGGMVFRKGVWSKFWKPYDTMTRAVHAASDHAAIYADVDV
jgi:endonuclease/exonuclease/phosphatase family metal-dependent hydrolase